MRSAPPSGRTRTDHTKSTAEVELVTIQAVTATTRAKGRWPERSFAYLAVLPALLLIAVFTIYPVIYAVTISLNRYILTRPNDRPFVGLQNFEEVIGSYYFQSSVVTTALYTAAVLVSVVVLGFAIALLLNTKLRTVGLLKIVILLPWAMPAVVSGIVWKWVLNSDFGILNGLLYQFGLIDAYIPFLANPVLAQVSIVIVHVWKEVPLVAIFFVAALQLIPAELYDCAKIDGAGAWARIRHVTLPLVRPTILLVLVYETLMAIFTFDEIYVLTGGGPANATALISWFAYAEIYKSLNLGHGIALSILIALMSLGLILIYLRLFRSRGVIYD